MRSSAGSRPIDDVVARLGHRLPWLLGSRADLVAEVRDGLEDAAEAHRLDGLTAYAAEVRAVDELGTVEDLVAAYAELGAARAGRWAAIALGLGYAINLGAWQLAGAFGDGSVSGSASADGGDGTIYLLLGVVAMTVAGLGSVALHGGPAATGRPKTFASWLCFVGWGSLLCALTTLTVSYVLSPWTFAALGQLSTRSLVEGFSVVWTATMLVTAVRCIAFASVVARAQSVDVT
jgi:hypothetical protein